MTPVPARAPSAPRPRPGPRPRPRADAISARPSGLAPDKRAEKGESRRLAVVEGAPAPAPKAVRAARPWMPVLIGAVVACALMLALAAVHSLLVSNQVRLDGLERQVTAEQARYASLRLEVAQLEAPERIVREAQERMGMIAPGTITYLSPSGAVAADVATPDPSAGGDGERSWAAVKPYLGDR